MVAPGLFEYKFIFQQKCGTNIAFISRLNFLDGFFRAGAKAYQAPAPGPPPPGRAGRWEKPRRPNSYLNIYKRGCNFFPGKKLRKNLDFAIKATCQPGKNVVY